MMKNIFTILSISFLVLTGCSDSNSVSLSLNSYCSANSLATEPSTCKNCVLQADIIKISPDGTSLKTKTIYTDSTAKKLRVKDFGLSDGERFRVSVRVCRNVDQLKCAKADPDVLVSGGLSRELTSDDLANATSLAVKLYPVNEALNLSTKTAQGCQAVGLNAGGVAFHGLVKISNDEALIIGGETSDNVYSELMQRVNLSSAVISPEPNFLKLKRSNFNVLRDSSGVIVFGGKNNTGVIQGSGQIAESYNLSSQVNRVSTPSSEFGREGAEIVSTEDGKLSFIVGGQSEFSASKYPLEILYYIENSASFGTNANLLLTEGRIDSGAAIIKSPVRPDQYYLVVAGGHNFDNSGKKYVSSVEVFDVNNLSKISTSSLTMDVPRSEFMMIKVDDFTVALVGGRNAQGDVTTIDLITSEGVTQPGQVIRFDTFRRVQTGVSLIGSEFSILPDGNALIAGGYSANNAPNLGLYQLKRTVVGNSVSFALKRLRSSSNAGSSDFFDRCSGREGHRMVSFDDGVVLMVGGRRITQTGIPCDDANYLGDVRLIYTGLVY